MRHLHILENLYEVDLDPRVFVVYGLTIVFLLVLRQWAVGKTNTLFRLLSACAAIGATLTIGLFLVDNLYPDSSPASFDLPDLIHEQETIPNVKDPKAIDPQAVCPGYKASNVQHTRHGFRAHLTLAGKPCNVYGHDIHDLTLIVESQASDRLHVEILPTYIGHENYTWFILPEELIPKPKVDKSTKNGAHDLGSSDLDFSFTNEPTFSFEVTRKTNGDVLFSTEGRKLVYEDQFIEFGSKMRRGYNVYGLGETMHAFRLRNNLTRTLFAADVGDVIDANLYGSHPFYLETRYFRTDEETGEELYLELDPDSDGDVQTLDRSAKYTSYTHGVFQRNAHGQDILLRENDITWRALGGTIDLYFYAGPSQDQVTKAYQKSAIGLPAMQQYWTFGFHQCRWGYKNWTELEGVVDRFEKEKIPLETIWSMCAPLIFETLARKWACWLSNEKEKNADFVGTGDIDYMNHYRDFENDPVNYGYKDGEGFLARLRAKNRHYVPIIDSAIYAPDLDDKKDKYPSFERGLKEDAFIMNPDGTAYIGEVWPGLTVFPDWVGAVLNGTGAIRWWIAEIERYHEKVKFDGIWIDMSEVSSFCRGSCGSQNRTYELGPAHYETLPEVEDDGLGHAESALDEEGKHKKHGKKPRRHVRNVENPPYAIDNFHGSLNGKTVTPSAVHHGGYQDYDFHNLFGHQILNATYHALLNIFPSKRPFIIGRSQFAGSAKWAGHWGGDNYSLWAYLYLSIPQALSYSLFGFPMFGVDACGFNDDTTPELCSRWMQLSAFFPFYRNHNELTVRSQESYLWPEVAEATRKAMAVRYALLPYMYTSFYMAHKTGSTVLRALAWEFADEPWLRGADRQFLLGEAVMVTPCLVKGADSVDGVFPGAGAGTVWYDWYNHTAIAKTKSGENVTIEAPLGHIPVYVRGGYVLPLQEVRLTTKEARATPWSLLVALDMSGEASGMLYLDDGESLVPEATTWVDFVAATSTLRVTRKGEFVDTNSLGNVTIMGVTESVSAVRFNDMAITSESWAWHQEKNVLEITGLDDFSKDGAWDHDWTLSWA